MPQRDPRLTDIINAVLDSYGALQPQTNEDREVNAQLIAHLQTWFESGDRQISTAATTVVSRFVDSELDFTTQGNRGMGRMTDYWPRFGGKHRKVLKRAATPLIHELHRLFTRQIYCGYFFAEYLIECMSGSRLQRDPASHDHEKVLYQWVPLIYSESGAPRFDTAMAEQGEQQYYDVKGLWGHGTGDAIHDCFNQAGIPIDDFEHLLLKQYFDAGIALRLVEAKALSETVHADVVTAGGYSALTKPRHSIP